MFSLICVWINAWVNNREAGDLGRHRGHYDVNVMRLIILSRLRCISIKLCLFADIDECLSTPCAYDGNCTDQVNGYDCSCPAGSSGVNCETGELKINCKGHAAHLVIGHLWGESISHRWTPLTKESDVEFWYFLWCAPEQTLRQTVEMTVVWDSMALMWTSL